jgi:two-component sensor histidine kinase
LLDRLPEYVRQVVEDPARLRALHALEMIDNGPDPDFDRLSKTAAQIFGAEMGLVTLLDTQRQWFSGCFGVGNLRETTTNSSFCAHTLVLPEHDQALVILDALQDDRFRDNPLVTSAPHVRFYAGVPITLNGQRIGAICVLSASPREAIEPHSLEALQDLSALASSLYALKDESRVRARTAAALIREEWRHALTLEAGKVGSWVWDVRSGEVACNDTFRRMYDLPEAGTIMVADILAATHPADRGRVEENIKRSLESAVDYDAEARVASTGRWLTMRGRVYQRDPEGKPLVMMGASIDISESKQSAEQTRLLLRELNHRVKNTLAMIQSVARQTIRQNPDPEDFIGAFSGRLRTISEAHVLLADRDWSGVQLYEVIGSQLGPDFLSKPDRADVSGPDVKLPPDHALGLGLILHELTTNALRHGAWSDEHGVVHIHWSVVDAPHHGLSLTWRETGGPHVVPPKEYGLGARLIERSLAKVLDSKVDLEFEAGGVASRIWMPLPAE